MYCIYSLNFGSFVPVGADVFGTPVSRARRLRDFRSKCSGISDTTFKPSRGISVHDFQTY
jgi:hypothetical protein